MPNFDQPFPDYELLDRVGAGAMGTVFKARHKRLNRVVALKILKPSLARDKRYVERLRREARIVASLSHPNIVTGYDLGEEGGYHYFVMEFVEGKSLRQLLVEWGMFAEEYVLRVARQVAEALDHAYERDIIHRDIKPGNVLINENGSVKLTDMGLAKGPADLTLTRDGATVGTPMYVSPEQARNPQDVDVRSDLYSLGATIYHMATGVPPFAGNTMAELITKVLNDDVVPPSEANSAVSPGLSLVIRKLLAKNLAVRYQTPRELLDDLDRLDRELPPSVDPARLEAAPARGGRWLRPALAASAAGLLAVAAWWIGRGMVEPARAAPDAQQFLAALDRELAALPSVGERFERLRAVSDAPSGSMRPLEDRRQRVAAELQAALDRVLADFEGSGRGALASWLRDPGRWPDEAQFEREQLAPRVRRACGVELEQLPVRIRRGRVEALRAAVQEQLTERDGELLATFRQHLAEAVRGRASSRARLGDFAGAAEAWRAAQTAFCDGVRHPLPERLPPMLAKAFEAELDQRSKPALRALDQAEQSVVRALRGHVTAALSELKSALAERDADPDVAGAALARLRANLGHFWPGPASFQLGRDPWPEVEQQLMAAEHAIELRRGERAARRFDAACDVAWAVYLYGDADAALAAFGDVAPATETQRLKLPGHLRCLQAVRQVELAVLRSIAARAGGTVGFLADAAEPFSLRVEPAGEGLRLFGQAVDQPARGLRLTELRLGNLLDAIGPVRGVASGPRQLGTVIMRLAAGDADRIGDAVEALSAADRAFVLAHVAPRLERARGERPRATTVDTASLFRLLADAVAEVEQGASPRELTRALLRLESRPPSEFTVQQQRALRAARRRRDRALREVSLLADLRAEAPRGTVAEVEDGAKGLVARVTFSAGALQSGAGEGWQVQGDAVQFAGGRRPFSEQPTLALRGDAGLGADAKHTQLELEVSFPDAGVGDRSYLVEFDGVSFALVLAADDSVHAELIDGSPLDEDRARRAYATALAGVFAPTRARAIPGALHVLTVDVFRVAPTQANVKVCFEGKELVRRLHPFDPARTPSFALHPLQEVSVSAAVVSASGL